VSTPEKQMVVGLDIGTSQIRSVFAGIAGSHIKSLNSHGIVAIKNAEVEQDDVDRVVDAAKAVAIPADQRILHVLPQEFIIDNQDGIHQPVGMSGVRLEAKVHLVTGSISAAQNIAKCIQRCNLEVEDVILEQLASSHSVLTDDERDLGVLLVDMGGGTTDIAVKVKYACALRQLASPDDMIEVPGVGDRNARRLARQTLAEVVEPRYEELLGLVQGELRRSGFEDACAAGVVLTGGTSKMEGVVELAEEIFHMPVRLGVPQHVNGLTEMARNPIHATGVGLLLYGQRSRSNPRSEPVDTRSKKGILAMMTDWIRKNF